MLMGHYLDTGAHFVSPDLVQIVSGCYVLSPSESQLCCDNSEFSRVCCCYYYSTVNFFIYLHINMLAHQSTFRDAQVRSNICNKRTIYLTQFCALRCLQQLCAKSSMLTGLCIFLVRAKIAQRKVTRAAQQFEGIS